MSKPALGRGLGSLLSSRPRPATETGEPNVSSGVAAIINGAKPSPDAEAQSETDLLPQQVERAARRMVFRGMLAAADLLLCLLAFLFVQRQPSVQFHELALCVAAVIIGGALSCVAVAGESSLAVRMGRTNGRRPMRATKAT
jgi:uncharacterized membrane protein YedE/YeeE